MQARGRWSMKTSSFLADDPALSATDASGPVLLAFPETCFGSSRHKRWADEERPSEETALTEAA